MRHAQRKMPLGVEPHLVVIFDLGAAIDPDEFRRSGLRVVDSSNGRVIIAFADDPELAAFNERLDALEGGVPDGQKSEPYAAFFDAINDLRPVGPEDRITEDVRSFIDSQPPDVVCRLDVECWHPGDANRAGDWLREVRGAVEAAGGRFVDSMVNNLVGLLLARVYVPVGRVMDLAELDVVARIDVLPSPVLSVPELFETKVSELPEVLPPDVGAPIVGVVDSGVASAHELIAGAVIASDAIGSGIEDDQDEHGHGTMVASILLHGDVARAISRGLPLRPMCHIASARVLDADNQFPHQDLWERDLAEAIEWCARQGATIINLSVGDDRSPFKPPRQMSAAAVVDDLARRLGLVVVAAAGNTHPSDYMDIADESAALSYPAAMLRTDALGPIDPASSMLSLTVGGMTHASAASGLSGAETVRRVPMGRANWPSPITRMGPGPGGSVKPELVHRSGTLGIEDGRLVSNDAELGVIGARAEAGRLLSWSIGTSFAAPAVARVAAAVLSRFPEFSAEMVRALVLVSAERIALSTELEGSRAAQLEGERLLVGYGRPSVSRAIESTSHRAVLVAANAIPVNGIHVYEIPIPSSFTQSGGKRGIDISLAYSPRTRVRRLDYMATRMEFHLVKGLTLDEVTEVFVKLEGEQLQDTDGDEVAADDEPSTGDDTVVADAETRPPSLTALGSRVVKLEPSTQVRSRGANQVGRKVFANRLDAESDFPMYLVVRNINHWDDPDGDEGYAVSVALWRDEDRGEIHAELEAQLEAVVELPIEVELEL